MLRNVPTQNEMKCIKKRKFCLFRNLFSHMLKTESEKKKQKKKERRGKEKRNKWRALTHWFDSQWLAIVHKHTVWWEERRKKIWFDALHHWNKYGRRSLIYHWMVTITNALVMFKFWLCVSHIKLYSWYLTTKWMRTVYLLLWPLFVCLIEVKYWFQTNVILYFIFWAITFLNVFFWTPKCFICHILSHK